MPIYMIIICCVAAVALAFIGSFVIMPLAVKKFGTKFTDFLTGTKTALEGVDSAVSALKLLLPENSALNVVDRIIDYAKQGVAAAEQMYKASQIAADERKATATQLTTDLLTLAGIEVTDDMQGIISGLIEAAVNALPKTNVTTATASTTKTTKTK